MRKNFKRSMISTILTLVMMVSLSACGDSPDMDSILSDGAAEFSEGKQEEDFSLLSNDEIMNRLIDEFSGSHSEPEGEQVADDDADAILDNTDPDSVIGGGHDDADGNDKDGSDEQGTREIASRRELKQAMHQMFDETKEVLNFRCDGNYLPDLDELSEIYLELEREDPFDVICLDKYGIGGTPNNMTVFYEYHLDTDVLKQMKQETRTLLKQAENKINVEGLSDYEIVCEVNDYLCDTIVYPETEPYAEETHTAYSAFKSGDAVCDGYSRAAKMLLNDYGIECDFVVGECIPDGGHAWNLVKLDGEWYHMDVTWNDGGAEWDEDARGVYLLVTDDFMKQSRVWDENVYPASADKAYQ